MKHLLVLLLLAGSILYSQIGPTSPTKIQPVQVKSCERGTNGAVLPCSFSNPVRQGDLIVVVAIGGCWLNCNSVSDSQGNDWKIAVAVPNYNGMPLWYALNAKGGPDTINFAPNTGWVAIIAEYPPSAGLEEANYGTYSNQVTAGVQPGGSNDVEWTLPVETTESCELLISWTNLGSADLAHFLDAYHQPTAGPNFTIRASEYGWLGLEDATTTTPGLYIGTLSWNTYAHWDLGVAAFKMGGCK